MEPPEELLDSAYRRPDTGECAWRRSDALRATHVLASRGQAIVGGEAWMILGGRLYLLKHEREEGYYGWECRWREGEPWLAFVERSVREAQAAISDDQPLRTADVPADARVYYNLTWIAEGQAPE